MKSKYNGMMSLNYMKNMQPSLQRQPKRMDAPDMKKDAVQRKGTKIEGVAIVTDTITKVTEGKRRPRKNMLLGYSVPNHVLAVVQTNMHC